MIIYLTTNIINNKKYIGMSVENNPKYLGSGKSLKFAIKKYGKNNFKKEIIDECDDLITLCEKEIYWIAFHNAIKSKEFYNLGKGGIGGDTLTNNPNRVEIIKKIGRKDVVSNRKNIIMSEEQKLKISLSLKEAFDSGRRKPSKHSEETKRKISDNRKGKNNTFGDKNPMWGKGNKILVNNIEYNNMRECAGDLKIHVKTIQYRLNSDNFPNFIRI